MARGVSIGGLMAATASAQCDETSITRDTRYLVGMPHVT